MAGAARSAARTGVGRTPRGATSGPWSAGGGTARGRRSGSSGRRSRSPLRSRRRSPRSARRVACAEAPAYMIQSLCQH